MKSDWDNGMGWRTTEEWDDPRMWVDAPFAVGELSIDADLR
jgi:hypothetical protein